MLSSIFAWISAWDSSFDPTKPCRTMKAGNFWPGLRPSGTCSTADSFRPSDQKDNFSCIMNSGKECVERVGALLATFRARRLNSSGELRKWKMEFPPFQGRRRAPYIHGTDIAWAFQIGDDVGNEIVIVRNDCHLARTFHHGSTGISVIGISIVTRTVAARSPQQLFVEAIQQVTQLEVIVELPELERIVMQADLAFYQSKNMMLA